VNFAPGWLGTAPVQRRCVAPSDTAEGLSSRARDRSPCRSHRQRVATPVARNGKGGQHPHTTPSPNHPAATRVSGDGTRKEDRSVQHTVCLKGSVRIHGLPSAVAAHRSRYPAVTATTRPRRSRHFRLASASAIGGRQVFGAIEAARSAGSRRHLPILGASVPRPAVGAIKAVEADRWRGGGFGKWRSTEVVVVVATFLGSVSWCVSRWARDITREHGRTWHAPFRRVIELAAPTACSSRSPSRDVRATP
jgi:hypothetical protein